MFRFGYMTMVSVKVVFMIRVRVKGSLFGIYINCDYSLC